MAPTSNEAGGYNNWYWYETVWDAAANAWRADINIANFNGVSSNYVTHIYVYDYAGNQGTKYDLGAIYLKPPGLSASEFKIGDYVAYQPDTATNATYSTFQDGYNRSGYYTQTISRASIANWRVLSVSGSKISLVSETIPSEILILRGADGYSNGVKLLNDACNALYKNTTLGATGRSMNVDDVNGLMGITEETKKQINSHYGNEYTPRYKECPAIFQYEIWGSINGSYTGTLDFSQQSSWYYSPGGSSASTLKGKNSYYEYTLSNYKALNTVQNALCTGGANTTGTTSHNNYWLASRSTQCDDYKFTYFIRTIANGEVRSASMYVSNDNDVGTLQARSATVRPCVDIDLSKVYIGITGTGESTNPYSIQAK